MHKIQVAGGTALSPEFPSKVQKKLVSKRIDFFKDCCYSIGTVFAPFDLLFFRIPNYRTN
jgi:hypothetical protein